MIIVKNNNINKIPLIKKKSLFNPSTGKSAICILTNEPDERLIQLYNNLIDENYHFYIIINNNNFDFSDLSKKYPKFNFIKIQEEKCIKSGFYGLTINNNSHNKPSIWDKAIYYFCNYKLNYYDYIWFIEEDVLITSPNLIYKIDKKYDTSYIDFLSKKSTSFNKNLIHSNVVLKESPKFIHKYLCNTLISAIRLSNKFLENINLYIHENKHMFFIESFFCTLANYYDLKIYDSIEFNNISDKNNKKWILEDIIKSPLSFVYPVKDLYQQIYFRKFFDSNLKIDDEINYYFLKFEEKHTETKKSAAKIYKNMIKLDINVNKLFKNNPDLFKKPDFRFYTNKNIDKNNIFSQKNAFITSLFINESYIPAALIWAKSFIDNKTKYPIVCYVQDKPFINKSDNINFPGISTKGILDLLKYFDLVIGVDLLEVKNYKSPVILNKPEIKHVSEQPSYKNSKYYATKLQILGLTEFEQLFYIDAAAYIGQNIDFVFKKFKGNFFHEALHYYTKSGAGGSHYMIHPNPIFYYKLKLFINNYQFYFQNLFFTGTVDELLLFYCVFPYWDGLIDYHSILSYKKWRDFKKDTPIRHFMKYKPFRPLPDDYEYKLMPENVFDEWDLIGKKVINQYPELKKYYQHISEFRKTKLF